MHKALGPIPCTTINKDNKKCLELNGAESGEGGVLGMKGKEEGWYMYFPGPLWYCRCMTGQSVPLPALPA
jgi:hypothetical protein